MRTEETENIGCEQFRELLVDQGSGALEPDSRALFQAHRDRCADCAREARLDESLAAGLEALPSENPPPTTWERVLASRTATSARQAPRTSRAPRRLALAFASATTAVALLLAIQGGLDQAPKPDAPDTSTAAEISTYVRAHSLVSASGMVGDPNRNVVLLYGAPAAEEADS